MFGMSGVLDSIPIVGHVKASFHYVTGDRRAARRSMYEATRSTAVIAGGAVGTLGGPAGIIAGAAGAGAAVDSITSVVTGEPQGIVLGVSDIVSDLSNGEVPLGSVVRTGLIVGSDIVGGTAGPALGNFATNIIESGGKSVGKAIIKQITKTEITAATRALAHGASRNLIDDAKFQSSSNSFSRNSGSSRSHSSRTTKQQTQDNGSKTSKSSSSGSSSRQSSSSNRQKDTSEKSKPSESSSTGGSGGQQPNNNQNNNKKEPNKKEPLAEWVKRLLEIFKKATLEEIIINTKTIFNDINDGQKKELKRFITNVKRCEYLDLEGILEITVELLSQIEMNYTNFRNFINIGKFVLAYVSELLTQRNNAYNDAPSNYPHLSTTYNERRNQLVKIIISDDADSIIEMFKDLMNKIINLMEMIDPPFVSVIAAVYHYFKHKFISVRNILYTPDQYFLLASETLARLKDLPRYQSLIESGEKRIVYEKYYGDIGRRLISVLKLQAGKWNFSSCYFADDAVEGDEDGDEWINGEKLSRN